MGFAKDFAGNLFNPVPVDPITTTALEHAPRGVQAIANPAGVALKKAVGAQAASMWLDPLNLGAINPDGAAKQKAALLAEGTDTKKTMLGG